MNKILISCITPTFNRAYLLKNAIKSTIDQTYPNWEMIIIDDGSTDNTEQIVKKYIAMDSRIKYYKNPRKGANAARNYGINQAKGKYIVFLDDDDEHLPHRFESQLEAIKRSGKNFILSGFMKKDFKTGKIIQIINKGLTGVAAGVGIRWIIKKELLYKAGLFDESMPSMQEVELSYRIAQYETFANHLDVVSVIYNNTQNSISKGLNGLKGKLLLLKKHQDKMPLLEAAWWYYSIGLDYYQLGKIKSSLENFKKAALLDPRKIYKIGLWYAKSFLKMPLKRINMKILNYFLDYKFPKLIDHEIIK